MMRSIIRHLCPAPAILLLAASPSYYFPKIDADEDGAISWEEYAKIGTRAFIEADTNFDGSLTSHAETSQLRNALYEADTVYFYRTADKNGDGHTDEAEFVALTRDRAETVKKIDTRAILVRSGDDRQQMTDKERQAQWKKLREEQEKELAQINARAAAVSQEMGVCLSDPTQTPSKAYQPYAFDCDNDGVVTLNEQRRLMKIRFKQKDKNEDGYLTEDELTLITLFSF